MQREKDSIHIHTAALTLLHSNFFCVEFYFLEGVGDVSHPEMSGSS